MKYEYLIIEEHMKNEKKSDGKIDSGQFIVY